MKRGEVESLVGDVGGFSSLFLNKMVFFFLCVFSGLCFVIVGVSGVLLQGSLGLSSGFLGFYCGWLVLVVVLIVAALL